MTKYFSDTEIHRIAEVDLDMEIGKIPFVLDSDGNRWPTSPEEREHFGFAPGQCVDEATILALVKFTPL